MNKLNASHKTMLLSYLERDPYTNLFLIGDCELFGFDDTIQTYYGSFEDGQLHGVVFRFRDDSIHLVLDTYDDAIDAQVRTLLDKNIYRRIMMGAKTRARVRKRLDAYIKEDIISYLSVYDPKTNMTSDEHGVVLGGEHADAIATLLNASFDGPTVDGDIIKERIKSGESVYFGVFVNDVLVSTACATAATAQAAMIVGVCTDDEHRNQGYATKLIRFVNGYLEKQGRRGVLFYFKPEAAAVYEKLGYVRHTIYHMIEVKE